MDENKNDQPVIPPQDPDIEIHSMPVQTPPPELVPEPDPPSTPEPDPQPSQTEED